MRRCRTKPGSTQGLTLIEALFAFAILAFCMAGFSLLILSNKKMGDVARDHYAAVNIAKSHLERARSVKFEALPDMVENDVVINQNGHPASDGRFRRTMTFTPINDVLADVSVMIEIRDRATMIFSGEHETVRTYIANTGD